MSPDFIPMMPEQCNEVGYLIANGKRVATLRCGEEAGHALERPANHRLMQPIPGTPHVARLEWEEPAREVVDDWPERYDADEKHDVEVPMLSTREFAALVQPPDEEPADLAEFDALLAQVVAETALVDRMIDGRREGD